jgi:hypothetical protein
MKLITQKQPFCGDFYIIRSIRLASISSFSKLFITLLFIFSLMLLLNFDTLAVKKNSQQVPVKKVITTPAKNQSSSKIMKGKKGSKSKKRVVIKKDTLLDIDPTSTKSPLYNN